MGHDSYSQSNSYNHLSPAEAQERYREDLVNRLVTESVGTVGLSSTMDLTDDEARQLDDYLAPRRAVADPAIVTDERHLRYGRGGWSMYGEVKTLGAGGAKRSDVDQLQYRDMRDLVDKGYRDIAEDVIFVPAGTDRMVVSYYFAGFADDTRRPSHATLEFTLSTDQANQLLEAMQSDPSVIDDVAMAQLKAIGLTDERASQYFHFDRGPIRSREFMSIDEKERIKNVVTVGPDGQPQKTEMAYRDKKPLDVPGYQEQTQPTYEEPVEEVYYDVEVNAAANEVREKALTLKDIGYSNFGIAVQIWRDRMEAADADKAQAFETVYSEVTSEPVDDDELQRILNEMNDAQTRAGQNHSLFEVMMIDVKTDLEMGNMHEGAGLANGIAILEAHIERLFEATGNSGNPQYDNACRLKVDAMSEVLYELLQQQKADQANKEFVDQYDFTKK